MWSICINLFKNLLAKKTNTENLILFNLSALKISKLIKSLNPKVKKAIDTAYNRIYKFHSLQKFKNISYTDKFKNKLEYKYLPLESYIQNLQLI